MHLDWRWIKQRPHFIAEGLSDFYDVTVVHFYSKRYLFRNSDIPTPNEKNLKLVPAFRLPFYQKEIIYDLNRVYMKLFLKFLIEKYEPDFVWFSHPQLYDYMPSNHQCKIVYDCMDLSTGFDYPDSFKKIVSDVERRLINDSDLIFVSSTKLMNRLGENYPSGKFVLVRNAFGGSVINDDLSVEKTYKKSFKIGYFGTIHSQLLDFNALKRTLDEFESIEYHFIGPIADNIKFYHDRVKFYGVVDHSDLYYYVKKFDYLILPFKLNELVEFVDPVKLYEYINFNKPIISVYYDELDYFSRFLYFYSSQKNLADIMNQIIKCRLIRKYSNSERLEFLQNNSWDVRIDKIVKSLEEL